MLLVLCHCVGAAKALFSLPYPCSLFPYAIFPIITTLTLPNSYSLSLPPIAQLKPQTLTYQNTQNPYISLNKILPITPIPITLLPS